MVKVLMVKMANMVKMVKMGKSVMMVKMFFLTLQIFLKKSKKNSITRYDIDENGRRKNLKKKRVYSGIKVRHALFHKHLVDGNLIKSSASCDASSSIPCTSSESKNVLNALNLDSGHDFTPLEIELLKLIDLANIEIPPHVQRLVQ
jgi:hypothetical protein